MHRFSISIAILGFMLSLTARGRAEGPQTSQAWPKTEVPGYGLTKELAEKDAMEEAGKIVAEFLRQQEPPLLELQIDKTFLEKYIFDGPGRLEDGEIEGKNKVKVKVKSWIVRLKPPNMIEFTRLNDQALKIRRDKEREGISAERLAVAGWIFGGMLVVLAGTMAYARIRSHQRP